MLCAHNVDSSSRVHPPVVIARAIPIFPLCTMLAVVDTRERTFRSRVTNLMVYFYASVPPILCTCDYCGYASGACPDVRCLLHHAGAND